MDPLRRQTPHGQFKSHARRADALLAAIGANRVIHHAVPVQVIDKA